MNKGITEDLVEISNNKLRGKLSDLHQNANTAINELLDEKALGNYLHYAPENVKQYFKTLNTTEQIQLIKRVDYLKEGIGFMDSSGKVDVVFAYDDIQVEEFHESNNQLDINEYEKVGDQTLFKQSAIRGYMKELGVEFPNVEIVQQLLARMPAQDALLRNGYLGSTNKCVAAMQLYGVLGIPFNSQRRVNGMLTTGSRQHDAMLLSVDGEQGTLGWHDLSETAHSRPILVMQELKDEIKKRLPKEMWHTVARSCFNTKLLNDDLLLTTIQDDDFDSMSKEQLLEKIEKSTFDLDSVIKSEYRSHNTELWLQDALLNLLISLQAESKKTQ